MNTTDHTTTTATRGTLPVMIDIETLGTSPGCVIFQLAAATFDPDTGATRDEFSIDIDVDDSLFDGLRIERDTHAWWEARGGITQDNPRRLFVALTLLSEFLHTHTTRDTELWSRGSDFDFPILRAAYEAADLTPPWRYFQQRDARTLAKIAGTERDHEAVTHNALDDVRAQCIECALALTSHRSSVELHTILPGDITPMPSRTPEALTPEEEIDQMAAAMRIED